MTELEICALVSQWAACELIGFQLALFSIRDSELPAANVVSAATTPVFLMHLVSSCV